MVDLTSRYHDPHEWDRATAFESIVWPCRGRRIWLNGCRIRSTDVRQWAPFFLIISTAITPPNTTVCDQCHPKISPRKKIIFSFIFWFHLIFLLLFFKVSLNKWVQSRIRHERRGEAKWHNMRKREGGGTLSIFYINKCRILYTRNVRKSNRFAKRCCQINLCENSFPWWDYLLLLIPMIDR